MKKNINLLIDFDSLRYNLQNIDLEGKESMYSVQGLFHQFLKISFFK